MVKREVEIKDGEAVLLDIIFGSTSLDEVIKESSSKRFILDSLDMSSVEKMTEDRWRSTQESTIVCPVIYLKGEGDKRALILKATSGHYWLANYRFTP